MYVTGKGLSHLSAKPHVRLHGPWLTLARWAWVGLALLLIVLLVVGISPYRAELLTTCSSGPCPDRIRALLEAGVSMQTYTTFLITMDAAFALSFLGIAGVIMANRADEPLALLAAFWLAGFSATFMGTVNHLAQTSDLWRWPIMLLGLIGSGCSFPFLYVFPDGRFVPRWSRWVAAGWVAACLVGYLSPLNSPLHEENTWFAVAVMAALATAAAAQFYRYRFLSDEPQRRQTRWVVLGFLTAIFGMMATLWLLGPYIHSRFPSSAAYVFVEDVGYYAFMLIIPVTIAVAILRYQLWEIRTLINRTLLYTALTAAVVGLYALVVALFGAILHAPGNSALSLLSVGLVAVLAQPIRDRLQRWVNQLMYGQRDEPYAVISDLGRRLEGTVDPAAALPTVVSVVTGALKLPYAELTVKHGDHYRTAATSGDPQPITLTLPLIYQAEQVGELKLAPRSPHEGWTEGDRRLLTELARQAGAAVNAWRLAADLRFTNENLTTARERLVSAREEERRRLRHQLHDGLSPTLAAFTLKLGAVRRLFRRDPDSAERLLAELGKEMETAVGDIRRLVYNLRPPALDQLGLLEALRARASAFSPELDGPRVELDLPEHLPPLPAAVEVAAYLIAQEALANVVRHAWARRCTMRLSIASESLTLDVLDDGAGPPADGRAGVGIISMRERAAELGGTLALLPRPGGGTRLTAILPLRPQEGSDDL